MISGQVVVKGMTYRLNYYEPTLVSGKDGKERAEVCLLFLLAVSNHNIMSE